MTNSLHAHGGRPETTDEAFLQKARALRPFYFIVVVWGELYTDFLLNFCVPALLSPNNIPALANRGRNRFLIATTDEDWERMQPRPIFRLLREYAEPVFVRIPPCPEDVPNCIHMGIGHKLATHMAFDDRAYGILLTPDLLVSDGTMAAVQRHAVDGAQVVLTAALRFGEEPLFKHLEKLGIASIKSRFGDEGRPLVATGRQLVWAGLRSFHSETLRYEWEKPYFAVFPSAAWWRVPDEDGIIVHSLSWAPLLVDYDAVEHHDSSMMDHWTIDGDYVYRNFGLDGKVHVVQDSDEIMLVSWAPLSDRVQSLYPTSSEYTKRFSGEWAKGRVFHQALSHPAFDPLKKHIFMRPVYWHARDVDGEKWRRVEKKAIGIVKKYGLRTGAAGRAVQVIVGSQEFVREQWFIGIHGITTLREQLKATALHTHDSVGNSLHTTRNIIGKTIYYTVGPFIRGASLARHYWRDRRRVLGIAKEAINGDPIAKKRIKRSFWCIAYRLAGLPYRAPDL